MKFSSPFPRGKFSFLCVTKLSALLGWYWGQSDLNQNVRDLKKKPQTPKKPNQNQKHGYIQSHLDENLQLAVGLQPKSAWLCSTAWWHCLASPWRGNSVQCLPVRGHSPLLCKRGAWLCMRWWHPSFFHHHQGQSHNVTRFPAWTRAKQSISVPQACMPKILAQSRRFPSDISHLLVPAPTPRLSLPGGEPATCGVTGFKCHGLKAL